MDNSQWYAHRAEMSNYMPSMTAFKRRRSGWIKYVENVVMITVIIVLLASAVAIVYLTTTILNWNSVLTAMVVLFLLYHIANMLHKVVYADDSGLHNLDGYDAKTRTVPSLEEQGFDTKKFWTDRRHQP